MLFAVTYTWRDQDDQNVRASLQAFAAWTPPIPFHAHYAHVDGRGGLVIAETDSAAKLLETVAPWTVYFSFDVTPVLDILEAVPLFAQSIAWRDSIA